MVCTKGIRNSGFWGSAGVILGSPKEAFGKIVRRRDAKSETYKERATSSNRSFKIFLKAMPLRKLGDLETIKHEVESGNILIVKVSPLANKSVEDIRRAVNELCEFVKTVDGDIARLGEERIVVTPSRVRIWREKTISAQEEAPTAA